ADDFNGRHSDGSYDQSDDLYIAVSCLVGDPAKGVPDRAEARQRVDQLAAAAGEVSPYFGAWLTYREQLCEVWPVAATFAPHDIHAPGAPPILLLNNSGDQVTTVEDAEAVEASLERAVLVVNEGTEHGTYLEGHECVDDLVEAFLLDGTLPAEGTKCE
ncbi:MAG TPA: hypothetical protein DGG94_14750, partial [Micromonosporaceae bacterium]|nr:hypothetical protein [Micromonosporaceae bacterium]